MDELPTPPNPFLADEASTTFAIPSLFDLFFLPGDWSIYLVARYVPAVADWFGLNGDDYGTSLAAFIAFAAWLVTFIGLIIAWASIRNFDRALTRGIAAGYADVLRRIRMVIALAEYRRRQRTKRTEPTIIVEEIDPKGLRPSSSSHLYD
jgi:hypothetical protein